MKSILKFAAAAAIFTGIAVSDTTSFTIHILGDSTVCEYKASAYPQTGWGQVIGNFFDASRVRINNVAIGGRSSKTFIREGRLDALKSSVQPGDIMLIQWGPNDRYLGENSANKSRDRQVPFDSLEYWLVQYVDASKAWGATPIFVAPQNGNNGKRNLYTEYDVRGKMEELSKRYKIPFVDLNMKSYNYYNSLNADYVTRYIFKGFQPGEYPNYPDGFSDGTHFQEMGSLGHSQMIAEELESNLKSNDNLSDESKTALAKLVSSLKKRYTIKVKTNLSNYSGLITQTQNFPAATPMTLRVTPNAEVFEKWVDDDCNELSKNMIYYNFKTKARDITYTAMFKGGAACTPASHGEEDFLTEGSSSSSNTQSSSSHSIDEELCSIGKGDAAWPSVIDMYGPEISDGYSEDNHEGYTGKGFFNIANSLNSEATYHLTSEQAATNARVMIRYSFVGSTNRDMEFTIDNGTYDVVFPSTGSWDKWDTAYIENVWVDALDFKMTIKSKTSDGGPNIDMIAFDMASVYRTGCSYVNPIAPASSSSAETSSSTSKISVSSLYGVKVDWKANSIVSGCGQMQVLVMNSLGKILAKESRFVPAGESRLLYGEHRFANGHYIVHVMMNEKLVAKTSFTVK